METRQKPIQYGFINTLTELQVNKAITTIEDLFEYWVKRNDSDSYTLGATLYEDIKHQAGVVNYVHIAKKMNPILLENFEWLYEIVFEKLSQEFGEPFILTDKLGYPGFHIFGHPRGEKNSDFTVRVMQTPAAAIHYDRQYEDLGMYWRSSFIDDYDLNKPISFTLSLELPKYGGGLSTWGVNDYEDGSDYIEYVKKLDYSNHEYGYVGPPDVVPYKVGKMFYFIGDMLHQISPAHNMTYDDRRITMQGHAIKCGGIWRVYF